jgi:uncharacterized protein YjeT (DUF2065 family)
MGYAILLGLSMALVIEGLVLALAPSRFDDILAALSRLTPQMRRSLGLMCVAVGVLCVALVQVLAG